MSTATAERATGRSVAISIAQSEPFKPKESAALSLSDTYAKTDTDFWQSLLSTKEYVVEASTAESEFEEPLDEKVRTLIESGAQEEFEYGMESDLTRRLDTLVRKYGDDFIRVLASFLLYQKVDIEVASEALRSLGRIDDSRTHPMRLWFLSRCLFSEEPEMRDAASLGLASLDDPQASLYLRRAIQNEVEPGLRENLRLVLDQLEATAQDSSQ